MGRIVKRKHFFYVRLQRSGRAYVEYIVDDIYRLFITDFF